MWANTTVECVGVERDRGGAGARRDLSMHGRIDNALPARDDDRRRAAERFLSVMMQSAVEPS